MILKRYCFWLVWSGSAVLLGFGAYQVLLPMRQALSSALAQALQLTIECAIVIKWMQDE